MVALAVIRHPIVQQTNSCNSQTGQCYAQDGSCSTGSGDSVCAPVRSVKAMSLSKFLGGPESSAPATRSLVDLLSCHLGLQLCAIGG